jgi:DNA-binding FrmR family transcriptional regulator
MAEPAYIPTKEQLLARLGRIEGQVRGVTRMVEEERYCIEVLTQISAAQKALDRVAMGLVSDHTRECVIGAEGTERSERTEELLDALDRLVSRR